VEDTLLNELEKNSQELESVQSNEAKVREELADELAEERLSLKSVIKQRICWAY